MLGAGRSIADGQWKKDEHETWNLKPETNFKK